MNTTQPRLLKSVGFALLLTPLLLQIPYFLLATSFDYPKILRQPASRILMQYANGGPSLTAIWYLFGILILPLLLAQSLMPELLKAKHPALLRAATKIGIASAIFQLIGLLRWVFAVPYLAAAYANASPQQRPALEALFEVQQRLLGVMIGEHLGQIFLALWTLGVIFGLPVRSRLERIQRPIGISGALLFLLGTGEILSPALSPVAGVAFLVWSVWCSLFGWSLLKSAAKGLGRNSSPLPEAAMEHTGLGKAQ